jgi:hypothetical protein
MGEILAISQLEQNTDNCINYALIRTYMYIIGGYLNGHKIFFTKIEKI